MNNNTGNDQPLIRHANAEDVEAIFELLDNYAKQRLLLGRSREDLLYHIKNFVVAELDGQVIACCALRDFGHQLYEVRSLAVDSRHSGKGLGSRIVAHLVDARRNKGACRIFALTYHPALFTRLGFHPVAKELFPPKIWCDCSLCPKKDQCDEDAVMLDID